MDAHTIEDQVAEFVDWITDLCATYFRITEPIDLDLRFGFDPFSTELTHRLLKEKEDDASDPVHPLTFGLQLLPMNIHDLTSLKGFWTSLRRTAEVDPAHKKLIFYSLLQRRDIALSKATQLALFYQMCEQDEDYVLTGHVMRQAALEARMDLRHAELAIIAFNLRIGVTVFTSRSRDLLFCLASALHKIRLFHFDMSSTMLDILGEKSKKKLSRHTHIMSGSSRAKLLENKPDRGDTIPVLLGNIAGSTEFLVGFYEEGLAVSYKTPTGRYLWDIKELATMVHLHDLVIRLFGMVLTLEL